MSDNQKYLSLSKLKEFGWTESKVEKLLGEPDKLAKNPFYSSGHPVKLYSEAKVLGIQNSSEFQSWLNKTKEKRQKLSNSLRKVNENKRKKLFEYIDSLEIKIPIFSKEVLYNKAIEHYNRLWANRGSQKEAQQNGSKQFLDRISVNMLRHDFSSYEEILDELFGQVGKDEGYFLLKEKVLLEISKNYPYLETECKKQIGNENSL